ncbi:MAG TPA: ATP-binding protein [Thermoanaerobaculia bacterium]
MNGRDLARESEERLRLALDAGRMGTWEWDLLTGGLSWSAGMERLFGLAPGTFEGTLDAFQRHLHPGDREPVVRYLAEAAEGEREPHVEYRVLRPDGQLRWIESWAHLLADEGGRPARMVGISRDTTERRRIEEGLRLLAEANSVLSASLDPDPMFQGVARLAVPDLGDYCVIDVVERSGLRRAAVHAIPEHEELIQEAMRYIPQGEGHPSLRAIRAGEAQLVSQVTAEILDAVAPVPEHRALLDRLAVRSILCVPLIARGKTRGAICLMFGDTGRTYHPWDVNLADELSRRVALAADNLYLYHDARQAVRARDQVLAVVSHDLRNLLNPVAISAEQLAAALPPELSLTRPLDLIRRSADQMDRLIQDLLDVARLEEGRLTLELERLAPEALVAEIVESHLPMARRKSLCLEREVAPEAPLVLADRHRLLRVLANLVGNALKFTPAGGRITVGAERHGDRSEVRFWVADTGLGISEGDQAHIFTPFWQVAPRERGGTGLGLSITKGIVEAHGGRVWVDSSAGSGSVFSFTIAAAPDLRYDPGDAQQ